MGEHDDFLNELLSGIETTTPAAPLSAVENDQLALIDGLGLTVVKVIDEPAPVVTPVAAKAKTIKETTVKPSTKKPAADKPATTKPAKAKAEAAPAAVVEPVAVVEVAAVEVAPVVVEAAPVAPAKAPAAPRMTFSLKSEKIAHKLGAKARDFLIMDTKDADLPDAELAAKQADLLKAVDLMAVKVGEKATMLFGYLLHGGKLNEVMRRTFTVLLTDGFLTTGDKGNLVSNLEKKPYSIGTCRSQATQMFQLFPELGICLAKEGGKLVMNPDSTILAKMKAELSL